LLGEAAAEDEAEEGSAIATGAVEAVGTVVGRGVGIDDVAVSIGATTGATTTGGVVAAKDEDD